MNLKKVTLSTILFTNLILVSCSAPSSNPSVSPSQSSSPSQSASPVVSSSPSTVSGKEKVITTNLLGNRVVPANTTRARGTLIFTLSADEKSANLSLGYSNLSSEETEASIHGPASATETAPAIITLPLGEFDNHKIDLTSDQVALLKQSKLYVSIKTKNYPNDETRGQIYYLP